MDNYEVEDNCLRIQVDRVIYGKDEQFFTWLANNEKVIDTVHLIGRARLTHLMTFLEQFNLILEKEKVTRLFIFVHITEPSAPKHRRLKGIISEYNNLTTLTITSPYIVPSIEFTERQYEQITGLNVCINEPSWLKEIPKFRSLRDLMIDDTKIRYDDTLMYMWRYYDGANAICKKLLQLSSLSMSINLFKLLSKQLCEREPTEHLEQLKLTGVNSVDSLAPFFLKLRGLKVIDLIVTNYHEILPMLNNCQTLVDVKIKGVSILMMHLRFGHMQRHPFFDTMLHNQPKRELTYGCGPLIFGEESYERLRALIKLGLIPDKKALYPLNYTVALKMVQHGYKLDPKCAVRLLTFANIKIFKHRCKLLKHFDKPFDINSVMEGMDPKRKEILLKIDL